MSYESVETVFQRDFEDIQTVVDFLISTGYTNIFISDMTGTMLADLENRTIENPEAKEALLHLIGYQRYVRIIVELRFLSSEKINQKYNLQRHCNRCRRMAGIIM